MVFLIDFFEKIDFEKKSADDKKHEKLPSRLRVSHKIIHNELAGIINYFQWFTLFPQLFLFLKQTMCFGCSYIDV